MSGLRRPSKLQPVTMALPKGPIMAEDLMKDIDGMSQTEQPMMSHQLPKGQLKLHQKNNTNKQRSDNRHTLDLLKGFAETAAQKKDRERVE